MPVKQLYENSIYSKQSKCLLEIERQFDYWG